MIQIHNSLTGRKETLKPIEPGHVRLYVCGMTVYDYCHIGHARVMVVFDTVVRYLRASGLKVTYVRNITDVDDKIIKRAAEKQESMAALTDRFIDAMHEDADALGVLRPDMEPRATSSMDDIVAMIRTLVEKQFAYTAPNGDVYYAVAKFARYGALGRENLADQQMGARVDVDANKRDPLDFVLWKAAKPGEPAWDSPWGSGRPGWHIECSAMATRCLGNHFDIHGGGLDLKFPHHENEIAQSEAATGEKFVNLWMHNGFVQVDEEKMSKSLGNFFTVREVLGHYAPEVVRYFILASHYRSPLNYSSDNLDQARNALMRFYTALRGTSSTSTTAQPDWDGRFDGAMSDDFNTPGALAVLFEVAKEINRAKEQGDMDTANELAGVLRRFGGVLGLLQGSPDAFLKAGDRGGESSEIDALVAARNAARANKDFKEADRVRDELSARGIVLEDSAAGTRWRRI